MTVESPSSQAEKAKRDARREPQPTGPVSLQMGREILERGRRFAVLSAQFYLKCLTASNSLTSTPNFRAAASILSFAILGWHILEST